MPKINGFVDLRVGHGAAGIGDESVWPSFTDIMTVIVMIFLMTLVVIMVRNFGLSSELLSNISAREAVTLANQDLAQKNTKLEASLQSTETERGSLSVSLTQAFERIASLAEEQLELQADLESMTAAREALEQANVQLQQTQLETSVKVEGLTADTEGLTQKKADLESALQSAIASLRSAEASLHGAEAERSSLAESLKQARLQIASLSLIQRGLRDEVASLTAAREALEQANEQLQQTQLETSVKVGSLTADAEDLAQQKAGLEAALQSAVASLRSAEAERSSLAESLKQARERIASLAEGQLELQADLASLAAAREALEQANEQLQQTQRETSVKVGSLTADAEDLAQQKAGLEAALQSAEAERSSLAESLKQARLQIASFSGSQRGLQGELAEMTANELLLIQNIGALDEMLAGLKTQSEAQISSLIDERATLEDRLYTLSEQLEHLRRLLSRSNLENQLLTAEMAQVERINESAAERYTRATDDVLSLKELIEQREGEIAALRASADTSVQEYRSLQEEYESLDVQYRKLVRPARSAVGKTVVNIRVEKIAGTLSYKIKRPDDSELAPVSRSQLDLILQNLKNQLGQSLYTKIVIPEDSNLTFNEAWGFTWEILQKYDYYYQ